MDSSELKSLIDQFRTAYPSKTSMDIYSFVKEHNKATLDEVGNFIKNFEDFFEELNVLVQLLNYAPKKDWNDGKKIQYLLYPETMKTLHCAFEITINGYYEEAVMLIRSVYEVFTKIVFLSCYPTEWEAVFYERKGKMQFQLTNFVRDHLKLDWDWLYRFMSSFYHGKVPQHMRDLAKISSGNKKTIIMEYSLDKNSLHMCVNLLTLMLNFLLHMLLKVFENEIENTREIIIRKERIQMADNILMSITETNPKEKFRKFASDLKRIGQIVTMANRGEDWKILCQ